MPRQMRIPFAVDPSGRIAFTTDDKEVDRMNVVTLLATQPGERAMRPRYGVPTRDVLFENTTDIAAQRIQQHVEEAVAIYAPEIEVVTATIESVSSNNDYLVTEGQIDISVLYRPAAGRLDTGIETASTTVEIGS